MFISVLTDMERTAVFFLRTRALALATACQPPAPSIPLDSRVFLRPPRTFFRCL